MFRQPIVYVRTSILKWAVVHIFWKEGRRKQAYNTNISVADDVYNERLITFQNH